VKRYDLENVGGYTEYREMREDPDGEWVRFDDMEKVLVVLKVMLGYVAYDWTNVDGGLDEAITRAEELLGEGP
jgi:hypothetical protein